MEQTDHNEAGNLRSLVCRGRCVIVQGTRVRGRELSCLRPEASGPRSWSSPSLPFARPQHRGRVNCVLPGTTQGIGNLSGVLTCVQKLPAFSLLDERRPLSPDALTLRLWSLPLAVLHKYLICLRNKHSQ